jgi:glutathione S-transferase
MFRRLGSPLRSLSTQPIFFDMLHSNNAARIRLWLDLSGKHDSVERRVVEYPDLQREDFAKVNPLKKVPALIRADGETVFEAGVILSYLEDTLGGALDNNSAFQPRDAETRQRMNLLVRLHDLYVASPNCTAPGFSHSQGAMYVALIEPHQPRRVASLHHACRYRYLSSGWHGKARGMDLPTRAAKLGELWRQLSWMEARPSRAEQSRAEQSIAGHVSPEPPVCYAMDGGERRRRTTYVRRSADDRRSHLVPDIA